MAWFPHLKSEEDKSQYLPHGTVVEIKWIQTREDLRTGSGTQHLLFKHRLLFLLLFNHSIERGPHLPLFHAPVLFPLLHLLLLETILCLFIHWSPGVYCLPPTLDTKLSAESTPPVSPCFIPSIKSKKKKKCAMISPILGQEEKGTTEDKMVGWHH